MTTIIKSTKAAKPAATAKNISTSTRAKLDASIPDDLLDAAAKAAKRKGESLNQWISRAMRNNLEEEETGNPGDWKPIMLPADVVTLLEDYSKATGIPLAQCVQAHVTFSLVQGDDRYTFFFNENDHANYEFTAAQEKRIERVMRKWKHLARGSF